MKIKFLSASFICAAIFSTLACTPLGKDPETSADYTPGLTTSTPTPTTTTYTVSISSDAHTSTTPSSNQTVNSGSTTAFTVTAASGYTLSTSVGGTCPAGSWNSAVYATGAITANCTVSFSSVSSAPSGGMGSGWTPSWNNLFAYWAFEETAAGTVNGGAADFADSGPVGTNYGTHSGTITYGATGKTGKAVTFNNTGCIQIPAATGFNSTALTVMAWVKPSSTTIGNIVSFYNAASSYQGWALLLNNVTGKGTFWGGTTTGFKNTTSTVFNDGSWHHFAAVANNTSLKLYVDGALDSTFAISAIPSYSGPGAIGADGDCLQKFRGTIDEMAYWNTPLSDTDITTIYTYQNTH